MSLPPEELIAINDLLIERETAFSGIGRIEDAIANILGQPYPLDPPKTILPSTVKKKKVKQAKVAAPKVSIPKLRKLFSDEISYRVFYTDGTEHLEQDILDPMAAQKFLEKPLPGFKINRVITLQKDLEIQDILYDEQKEKED